METTKNPTLITPGKWYAVFNENGNAIEAFYDESYRKILGYEKEEEYANAQQSWIDSIHPDDRERVEAYVENTLIKHSEGIDYDIEYRMMTKWGYRWFHDYATCTRRKDGSILRCDGVVFDIQELKDYELHQLHDNLRKEVLNYIINHEEDDPIELLSRFAEKIRVLIDCDQVIYRDLEATRIMVNSPAIEKTWSVPESYCRQCQHFDAHHSMYAGGYTEMDNCQEGWQGIPVFHKCPIKSSLTRIVYCNGEIAGYLAIHYVQKYHHFTDLERETLEDFVNGFSLLLTRYEARKQASELNSVKRTMNMIFSLSDEYDPVIVIDPESGAYDWLMSKADEVVRNTTMSVHGEDFYQQVEKVVLSVIHEEDRARMRAFYTKENMLKVVETGETMEIESRWFIPEFNEYRWKYNKVVRMIDDSGKAFVVVGVIDTTEKKQKEEEQRQQQLQLQLNNKVIKGFAAKYEAAFIWNLSDGTYSVISNKDKLENQVTDVVKFGDALKLYVKRFVHPDDAKKFTKEILDYENMQEWLEIGQPFSFEYKSKTQGEYTWRKIIFNRISDVDVLVGIDECEKEMVQNLITDKLLNEYDALYLVDLNKDEIQSARSSRVWSTGVFNEKMQYHSIALQFAESVAPQYKQDWILFSNVEYLREYLSEQDHREYTYELPSAKQTMRRVSFDVLERHNGTASTILLSFVGIDDITAQTILMQRQIEEALNHANEEARRTDLLYDVSNSGKWEYHIDVNDQIMTAGYSDKSIGLVHLTDSGDPMGWTQYLHQDDKERVLREFWATVHDHTGNTPYDTTFRMFDKVLDKIVWIKSAGRILINSDGTRDFIGITIDISNQILEQEKQKRQLQENFDIINILASEYTSVYYIDLTTDGLTPYAMNEDTEKSFGSVFRSGITYSEAFRLYVDKLVLAADRDSMLKAGSLGNIMKELRSKKTFLTTYRDADGHYSEMKFVKVGNEEGTPTAVALGFADKDAELRAQQEKEQTLQRNIDIIEILASEYSSVYYIDLTTDELDPYTMNEETETEFGKIFRSGIHYSEAFRMYVDTLVFEDDKQMMLEAGSLYNILWELATKKTFITTYRNSEGHYSEMKFVKVGDEENPQSVALGFADKDEEIRAEMEHKIALERDNAVISGLSDDFGCVVYVSYDNASEYHYRFDPMFEQYIPGWAEITNFADRMDALTNIIHPDDKVAFRAATQRNIIRDAVAKDDAYFVNFRILVNGESQYYQAKFVKDEHSDDHVIAGFHNVDAETKREMEALNRAESASRAKTDFLFNMSHDIRTPMNAIIGFTDMALRNPSDTQKITNYLGKVKQSSDMLLSLINDILDMSRIESGKVQLSPTKEDLSHCFDNIASVMSEIARKKDIALSFNTDNVKDTHVFMDKPRVERILINLVSNAVKYTQDNGWVKATIDQIKSDREGYGLYKLTIADNGIGMSEEFQKHMFDEFTREENSTTSGIQGTGLGLSLARKLTQIMGGTIACKSKQGEGSVFTVTLPLKLQTTEDIRQDAAIKQAEKDIDFTGRQVLLVEDNDLNREIATAILEDLGIKVEGVSSGHKAIRAVRDHDPHYYDVILMDIQMPIMDGYETTRQIRDLERSGAAHVGNVENAGNVGNSLAVDRRPLTVDVGRNIPIIALSANAFEEDRQNSREVGMNDHIAKPINLTELKEVLAKFMK